MSIDIKQFINVYEFDCKLPGSGDEIKFKPITTGQMKKLLIYENSEDPADVERALDDIITGCVITEGFDVMKLWLQDRFYLLLEIRKKSKGESYSYTYTCPECKSQTLCVINMDDLPVKQMKEIENPTVKINEQLSVDIKLITREDQEKSFNIVKNIPGLTEGQQTAEIITYTYAMSLGAFATPNGVEEDVPLEDKVYLLDNLPDDTYADIQKWYTDNDFGLEFTSESKCRQCSHTETVDIPMSGFFG